MTSKPSRLSTFFAELHRRRVLRAATVYLGIGFVILEACDMIFPRLGIPDWTISLILGMLAAGFPAALFLSWLYEITPDGMDKSQDSELPQTVNQKPLTSNIIIAVLAGIILTLLVIPNIWETVEAKPEPLLNPKSIAVLPFTSFASSEEASFFADGITDVILTQLAKVGDLKVISRTSTIQYRNTEKTIPIIAAELGVANILEGSIQLIGDQVRIIGQLIRAETDEHLWAETFDRDYEDVFSLQSEVARSIASALKASLTPEEEDYLSTRPTENQAAWDIYLRANILGDRQFDDGDTIITLYEEAIRLDPLFTLPYAKLIRLYTYEYFAGYDPDGKYIQKAQDYLVKLASLDSASPNYHLAKGYYHYYSDRDFEAALAEFEIARISQPNNSDLFLAIGLVKRRMGLWNEATEYFERAVNLDPRSAGKTNTVAENTLFTREWQKTRKYLEQMTTLVGRDPALVELRYFLTISSTGDLSLAEPILGELIEEYGAETMAPAREMKAYLSRDFRTARELVQADKYRGPADKMEDKAFYFRLEGLLDSSRYYYGLARDTALVALQRDPDHWMNIVDYAVTQAGAGDMIGAKASVDKLLDMTKITSDGVSGNQLWDQLASLFIMVGDYDQALHYLDKTLSAPGDFCLALLILEPEYDTLRDHPQYSEMLTKYADQIQVDIIF
ncbi:MAG: hypothetical protein HQ556_15590 [Candidatus Marinimicrobia bacterium]|nr:hypothetical protein [Candidatus Neomarinimicrobiota bacterium]